MSSASRSSDQLNQDRRSLERLLNPSCLLPTVLFSDNTASYKNTSSHWFVSTLPLANITAPHMVPFKAIRQHSSPTKPLYMHHPSGALLGWYADPSKPENTQSTQKNSNTHIKSAFERQTALRQSLMPLLTATPSEFVLSLVLDSKTINRRQPLWLRLLEEALYTVLVNTLDLPCWKKTPTPSCRKILLSVVDQHGDLVITRSTSKIQACIDRTCAMVEGLALCRSLSSLPSNILHPSSYRAFLHQWAKQHQYQITEWDQQRLKQQHAGAFLAVTQGHEPNHSAIIKLEYQSSAPKPQHTQSAKPIRLPILVGKGVCFDTGGYQIKSAKAMMGMHQDMNGSAVALGLFHTLARLQLFPQLQVYVAIADNVIGPKAYRPNDVVEAINGKTIEIVHTDAEGRLLLADTLALITKTLSLQDKKNASNNSPLSPLIIDFATLTGSMITAIGCRMSGVFGNSPLLNQQAQAAGDKSGERLWVFPMPKDYNEGLHSNIADILQCRIDGDADHLYAALFLQSFVNNYDWLHIDLSASECEGGLGAVAHQTTGFGVRWGVTFLESLL